MLLVGIDWAEAEHAACLMAATGAVLRRLRVPHTAAGLRQLCAEIAEHELDSSAVFVAIERPDGLVVDALVDTGYCVYALNPKVVERYRGRTRVAVAKTDPADAELLARILVTDRDRHRPMLPSSAPVQEIRALARDDERAGRDERRLLSRLRHDLLAVFPQALVAFPDLASTTALAFLARWPSAETASAVSDVDLAALLREHRHGWPVRAAARIRAALDTEALTASTHLARAKASTIRLEAEQLLLLHRQRVAWRRQLADLLAGEGAHPDGEVLLSLPGLDARLAARLLGEIGDRRERFPTRPPCNATPAPRRSQKRRASRALSVPAWLVTASSARPSSGGRLALSVPRNGPAPSMTPSVQPDGGIIRPCVHWATDGWRSSITCCRPGNTTTKPSTSGTGRRGLRPRPPEGRDGGHRS